MKTAKNFYLENFPIYSMVQYTFIILFLVVQVYFVLITLALCSLLLAPYNYVFMLA